MFLGCFKVTIRASEAESITELEKLKSSYFEETSALKEKMAECLLENDKLRQTQASNFTPEKAHQLANQVEEISTRKSELEKDLERVRLQKNQNAAQLDEAKLAARQAQEMFEELRESTINQAIGSGNEDLANARVKSMDLATKLSESRLSCLRAQRKVDQVTEQMEHQDRISDRREKELSKMQKQVAETELQLQRQEEEWRQKLRDGQDLMGLGVRGNTSSEITVDRALQAVLNKNLSAPDGQQQGSGKSGSDTEGAKGSMRHRWSMMGGIEDVLNKLSEKTDKCKELEDEVDKVEKHHMQQNEQLAKKLKQAELQIKLLQANLGEDQAARLKNEWLREHDDDMKKVAGAAKESVALLQDVLEQKEQQLRNRDSRIDELELLRKEQQGFHQHEINELKGQIITAQTMAPLLGRTSVQAGIPNLGSTSTNETALRVLSEQGKKMGAVESERDQFMKLLNQKEQENSQLKLRISEKDKEVRETQSEHRTSLAKLEEAEKNYDASNLARIVQICRKQLKQKQGEINKLKSAMEDWKKEQVEKEAEAAKTADTLKAEKVSEEKLKEQIRKYEARLADMGTRMSKLQDELVDHRSSASARDSAMIDDRAMTKMRDTIHDLTIQRDDMKVKMQQQADELAKRSGVKASFGLPNIDSQPTQKERSLQAKIDDLEDECRRLTQRNDKLVALGGASEGGQSPSVGGEAKLRSLLDEAKVAIQGKMRDVEEKNSRIKRLLDRIDDLEMEREDLGRKLRRKENELDASSPTGRRASLGGGMPQQSPRASSTGPDDSRMKKLQERLEDMEDENKRLRRRNERLMGDMDGSPTKKFERIGTQKVEDELEETQTVLRRVRKERDELKRQVNGGVPSIGMAGSSMGQPMTPGLTPGLGSQMTPGMGTMSNNIRATSPGGGQELAQKNDLLRVQVNSLKQRCERTNQEYDTINRKAKAIQDLLNRPIDRDMILQLQREARDLVAQVESSLQAGNETTARASQFSSPVKVS